MTPSPLFPPRATSDHARYRPLVWWLCVCIVCVMAMVTLGGATRLTESGLSIVEWQPFKGVIPPLDLDSWSKAFEDYKQFPEYALKHAHMTLNEFRFIYLMEYSHRLLGRLVGLVFILPMLYFWKRSPAFLKKRYVFMLILGMLQGAMGWYMVKSGLVKDPYVSHYRLAAHLSLAFILIALFIEAIGRINMASAPHSARFVTSHARYMMGVNIALVAVTIVYGAFVAGLRAGALYNTFPLMGGDWIPFEWQALTPLWLNFLKNPVTVQWTHRMLGSVTLIWTLYVTWHLHKTHQTLAYIIAAAVICQFTLGVLTLIFVVPIPLALLHQMGAVALLGSLVWTFCLIHFPKATTKIAI